MGRPKNKTADPAKLDEPALRLRVFIRSDMIGSGKIEILNLVGETGSISGAAREMGLSYRRVWSLLKTIQRSLADHLFTTSRGGGANAGAQLTDLGKELVVRYGAFEEEMKISSKPFLEWIKSRQAVE